MNIIEELIVKLKGVELRRVTSFAGLIISALSALIVFLDLTKVVVGYDLVIIISICLTSLVLFTISIYTRSKPIKILWRLIASFVILHLLIFPYLYLFLLNQDSKSLMIDNDIKNQETQQALKNLSESYNPAGIAKKVALITSLIESCDTNLEKKLGTFNSYNILLIDTFLLYGIAKDIGIDKSYYIKTIFISNKNGRFIESMQEGSDASGFPIQTTLHRFLLNKRYELKNEYTSYNTKQKDILEERRLWTYKTILPYVINIFSNDNIKPKSRAANVINFIHNFFVIFLLLAMIGSLLLNILTTNRNGATLK